MNETMLTENRILMLQAREALKGQWGLAVGTFLVYIVISSVAQEIPNIGWILSLIISGPMDLGLAIFSLALSRHNAPRFSLIFEGFNFFGTALVTYLLMLLFVVLWSLLLIVPGIMAALSYSMVFYILAEDDSIAPMEAIKKSKAMMYGYRWKLFCLGLRFIGWIILGIITFGIGFLWVGPYMNVSFAKFYDDLQ